MALTSMHKGAMGSFFKFTIFGLLGLAVFGMTITDIGSAFQGGVSSRDIARVEDKHITIQNFDRILRRHLSQQNMSPQDALRDGTLRGVLANEIRANFVDIEATDFGLALNKDYLQKRIAEMVAPHVQEGQTMQQTLDVLLRTQQMDEPTFVKGVTRELAADIVTDSVKSAFPPAQYNLAKDLFQFQNQTRDIDLLTFTDESIADAKPATEEQIKDLYEKQKKTIYSTPELRHVKIGLLDNEAIIAKIAISDEDLKKFYDENTANFVVQKQTILSQVIIPDKAKAQQVMDLVSKGEKLKAASEKIMKEDVNYFEKVPFDLTMMIPDIAKALEGKDIGAVVGPIETQLGNHVVQLDGYTEEKTQDFASVKDSIRDEMLGSKGMDTLFESSQTYDDLIANGTSFEEITKEVPLKIFDIPAVSRFGQNEKEQDAFVALPENLQQDKPVLLEAIFATDSGETSRIIELPSGNFAAVKIDSVQDTAPKSFESVKQQIADSFIHEQKLALNKQRVTSILKDLKDKKMTFSDLATREKLSVKPVTNLGIAATLEAPLTEESRPTIFKTSMGGFDMIRHENGYTIMHIKGYSLPELTDANQEQIKTISNGLNEEMKGEAFAMYLDFLAKKHVAIINEHLLERVYGKSNNEGQQ